MNVPPNPYAMMQRTFNPKGFFGRENEIINILQVITAPDPNGYAIFGFRTLGKSSLLKFLKDPDGAILRYEDYMHPDYRFGYRQLLFVYINFHPFREDDNIFEWMLSGLKSAYSDRDLGVAVTIPRHESGASVQEIISILRETLQKFDAASTRVVFLMDDFDEVIHYIGTDEDRLLRMLSELTPMIIATDLPISELNPDFRDSPFLNILRPEGLKPLSLDAARQLITSPAADVKQTYTESEITLLMEVAGLHPFLLTVACEQYFNMRNEFPAITQQTEGQQRDEFKKRFVFQLAQLPGINNVLEIIWKRLNETEQKTLAYIAQGNRVDMLSSRAEIAQRLSYMALAHHDMVSGEYRLFSELFVYFVNSHNVQNISTTRPLTPIPDSLLESESPLDKLTPIDRAVLDYLEAHPNKVCETSDILIAVWDDDTETKKRALEAAVYRIRKTLESMGSAKQIRNVRGRGYKLIVESVVQSQ